ncbi:MAG: winged helix-turn-helix transcriptional regulator [Deltaproteobacteria bacterium]|nr:winged helix-turn-helix transcriptional regulator [Deltaproteobacteria bacterium]
MDWKDIGRSCACYNIRKAARAVTQFYDAALRPSGLRLNQFSILMSLKVLGPSSLGALAEATVTDRTTMTRNLRPLEKQGFVRSEPGADPRSRRIVLTDVGASAVEAAVPLWEETQKAVKGSVGDVQIESLLSTLRDIVRLTRRR